MIESKSDYKRYMEMDARALGYSPKRVVILGRPMWRYERSLRHLEYNLNVTHSRIRILFWKMINRRLSFMLGCQIPPNTCGGGLRVNHHGYLVINSEAKIGDWADIHQGVNIGTDFDGGCPVIGNHVWIGPGAKLFGRITIADNIAIGANAVVNKSFTESGISIAGVPAKKISDNGNKYMRT